MARRGLANGVFEELLENVPAMVEEFYPKGEVPAMQEGPSAPLPAGLEERLEEKLSRTDAA